MESDWTCAFDSGSWSLPLSEEDLGVPLEAHLLAVGGSGDGSCSDQLGDDEIVFQFGGDEIVFQFGGDEIVFQFGGDEIAVDAYLVMDQSMGELVPPPPPPPHPEGGELVGAEDFCFSDSTLVDNSRFQFGVDASLDHDLVDHLLPALSMYIEEENCTQGLGTTGTDNALDGPCIAGTAQGNELVEELHALAFNGSGDQYASSSASTSILDSGFHVGGDVLLDDALYDQDLLALSRSSGEEIPVQGSSTSDKMDIEQRIGDHTTQSDVLVGSRDELVSDGSAEYASSSDSTSVPHSWLPSSGVGSLSDDDKLLNYDSDFPVSAGRPWPVKAPSESIGVDERENGTWEAHIWLKDFNIDRAKKEKNGMQFFLGSFNNEDDAKRAHDKAAIMLNVRVNKYGTLYSLNYPEEQYADYIAEHAHWSRRDYMWKMRRESGKFSRGGCSLKGVMRRKSHRKPGEAAAAPMYTATMSVTTTIDGVKRKTTMTIGHFESDDEAGREYDKALLFVKGMDDSGCITNFRPGCYSESEVQDAGRRLATAYPRVNFTELSRKHSGVFAV